MTFFSKLCSIIRRLYCRIVDFFFFLVLSCGFLAGNLVVSVLLLRCGPSFSLLVPSCPLLSPCPLVLLSSWFLSFSLNPFVFIVGLPHKKNTFTIFQSGLLRGFPLTIAPLPPSTSYVFRLPTALILIIFLVFNSYFCGGPYSS